MDEDAKKAFFIERPLGVVYVTGQTRLDLIDRMSTQKVRALKAGEGAATVLTTDIGRIIDRLLVYAADSEILFLTGENNAANIINYFRRYIFFNDDFHMRDATAETAVLGIYGAAAQSRLAQAGLDHLDLSRHHWHPVTVQGVPASIHRTDPINDEGYFLLLPIDSLSQVQQWLTENDITAVDADTFEQLRIANGLPLLGHELTTDYIPLESGLWDDISFNKGCYIGQEIIARMESRGQISKKLVKLQADSAVEQGAEITADGRKAGAITSAVGNMALGYVKTAVLEADKPLTAGNVSLKIR